MGDRILSSLSTVPPRRVTNPTDQPSQPNSLQGLCDDTHPVPFVALEIVTVTDYAEVELCTSTESEEVVLEGEKCSKGTEACTVAQDSLVVLPDETLEEREEAAEAKAEETQTAASQLTKTILPEGNEESLASSQHKRSARHHDCPDCKKKFKFASSLIAHRVIHTGERPHHCNDCGRCFSFRQSLDRHRHTQRTGHSTRGKYNCAICGETFHSLSARTQHKQEHKDGGVFACHQCSKKFNGEPALVRHLKTHTDNIKMHIESQKDEEVIGEESICEVPPTGAEPDRGVPEDGSGENAEVQAGEHPISKTKDAEPEQCDIISPVKVRTSGRKRKPTMKVMVINLQKRMATKRQKICQASGPELKPLPFSW